MRKEVHEAITKLFQILLSSYQTFIGNREMVTVSVLIFLSVELQSLFLP